MRDLSDALIRVDDSLTAQGVPPLGPRWRSELCAFYASGARVHAARIGRGGSKSTASAKCLVVEVLAGKWTVPPGERHWGMNISENLDEARARLTQIEEYLTILGVSFERTGDQILLSSLPLGFWSRPARIGALKGPRVVAWSVDEAATLSIEGVNPSPELVASLKAASVTHAEARGRLYSSPWGMSDYHYETIEAGTTPYTFVSVGPSWDWNPAITEESTRALEPDPKKWRREYLAIPGETTSGVFDLDARDRAMRLVVEGQDCELILSIDAAFRADEFGYSLLGFRIPTEPNEWLLGDIYTKTGEISARAAYLLRDAHGNPVPNPEYGKPRRPVLVVHSVGTIPRCAFAESWAHLARMAKRNGVRLVVGDQHHADANASEARRHGLRFESFAWGPESKARGIERLQMLLRDGDIVLPDSPKLAAELASYIAVYNPSGTISYRAQRGHDDALSSLITGCIADTAGLIPSSPLRLRHGVSEVYRPTIFD